MAKARTAPRARSAFRQKRTGGGLSGASGDALASTLQLPIAMVVCLCVFGTWWFHRHYAIVFQSPVALHFQSPVVVTERTASDTAAEAEFDQQGRKLSGWQQYVCRKFGRDCRLALAIQRAENAEGKCEIYHYNSDGSLDWGYFQINTVHLQRSDLNLRDLLDCKANIDFAHRLYLEKGGFSPWSTFKNGRYRQFLMRHE